jgi:signal transduction histidine kinase
MTRAEVTPVQAMGSGRVVALMAAISRALAEGEGVDATLQGCAEALVRQLGAVFARVWLCRPDDVLQLRASAGLYTRLDGSHSRIRVGELKIGRIAAERRPHLTNAVLDDPSVDDKAWARREGMVAFAGYPLLVERRTVGVMALFAREPLSADVLEALAAIADAVAQYVERARAEADLRRAHDLLERRVEEGARQLATLLEVGRELASTHELGPLLGSLLGRLQAVVAYDGAAILLREGEELCYAAVGGPDRWEEARHVRYPLADFQPAWERLRRDEPILVGDVLDETPDARLFRSNTAGETGLEFIRSLLWVPLVVRGGIIGLLSIARSVPHAFTPPDAELALAIARQAAVAIENARLHERARDAAVLEERQRLARELHDSVTQALYSLKLYAEAAGRQLDAGDRSTAREHLREVRASAGEALAEMRLLLHELRPPLLREHGLGPALRARLAAVEGRSGLATDARLDEAVRLPAAVEQDLYRIAQEALNNVLKHARASRVTLAFGVADGYARLEVSDDGAGFDPDRPAGGLGLAGIRERAAHVGGVLRIESAPGAGTRIVVEVPR